MSSPVDQVLQTGPSTIEAARALEARGLGKFPYQWIWGGPNCRHVLAPGLLTDPVLSGVTAEIMRYQVPEGARFQLRGVVFEWVGATDANAVAGVTFDLVVVASAGPRKVDGLSNIPGGLGHFRTGPYWLDFGMRLEFAPRDVLAVNATASAETVSPLLVHLVGHTYPNSEAA